MNDASWVIMAGIGAFVSIGCFMIGFWLRRVQEKKKE